MTTRIEIKKKENTLSFYLVCDEGTAYLFSQRFTKGVYEYFRRGRTEQEIRRFRGWGQNPRLDHTIEKCCLPSYRKCAMEELTA